MYIDHIWPFTTFISRNKHNKNIRLRLYWLRLRVAEAEVQTSHSCPTFKTNYAVFNLVKKLQKKLKTQAYKLVQPNKTITDICDDFLRLWSLAKHSTMPFSFHGFPLFVHLFLQPAQGKTGTQTG